MDTSGIKAKENIIEKIETMKLYQAFTKVFPNSKSNLDNIIGNSNTLLFILSVDKDKFRTELLKVIFFLILLSAESYAAKLIFCFIAFYVAMIPIIGKLNITFISSEVGAELTLISLFQIMDELMLLISPCAMVFLVWNLFVFAISMNIWIFISLYYVFESIILVFYKITSPINLNHGVFPVATSSPLPSPSLAAPLPQSQNDQYCFVSGDDAEENISPNTIPISPYSTTYDALKEQLYRAMKNQPTKFCFIHCLEIPDQVLFVHGFVDLVCSRYDDHEESYKRMITITAGCISIEDYKTIMATISNQLHNRYRVFRKAYWGENRGHSTVDSRCLESFDCLIEVYGHCDTLSRSFNLLVHKNHIRRYIGVWTSDYVNRSVGLGLWCDQRQELSDGNKE